MLRKETKTEILVKYSVFIVACVSQLCARTSIRPSTYSCSASSLRISFLREHRAVRPCELYLGCCKTKATSIPSSVPSSLPCSLARVCAASAVCPRRDCRQVLLPLRGKTVAARSRSWSLDSKVHIQNWKIEISTS